MVGMEVNVIANVFPNVTLLGKVESVSDVPFSGSKFDCLVSFAAGELTGKLIPTTGCRVEFPNVDPVTAEGTSGDHSAPDKEASGKAEPPATDPMEAERSDTGEAGDAAGAAEKETQADKPLESKREDPISGTWSGSVRAFDQEVATFEMVLHLAEDDSVTGTLSAEGESLAIEAGKFQRDAKKLAFCVNTPVGLMEPEFEWVDKILTATVTTDEGMEIVLRAVKQ